MTKIDLLIRNLCENPDVPDPEDARTILVTDTELRSAVEGWLEQEYGLVDGPCCGFEERRDNEEDAGRMRGRWTRVRNIVD